MDADTESRLLKLLAERDIHQVLRRYCRGVDRCDAELIAACYHPDAIDDHGNWLTYGRDAHHAILPRVKPGDEAAMHFLGNVLIEVEGDTAFAESYLLAFRTSKKGARSFTRTRAVRFMDRFERRHGDWRIAERVVVDDWNRIDEIVEQMADTDRFRYSTKDKTDPVYTIRRGQVARDPGASS